jgi:hypothetical protein
MLELVNSDVPRAGVVFLWLDLVGPEKLPDG